MNNFWSKISRLFGVAVILCLVLSPGVRSAGALAQQAEESELQIAISTDAKELKTGDTVNFETVVTNAGAEKSPPVIVAMNIINLSKNGDVVDPEDWSPERTQYLDSLAPNESATLSWEVNAVLDGNYVVYMVAVPEPESAGTSTQAVASRGLHLSVARYTRLNPGGILPYAIGVPVVVVLTIFLLFRVRNRQIDAGETS